MLYEFSIIFSHVLAAEIEGPGRVELARLTWVHIGHIGCIRQRHEEESLRSWALTLEGALRPVQIQLVTQRYCEKIQSEPES